MDPTNTFPAGDRQPPAHDVDTLAQTSTLLLTTTDESIAAAQMLSARALSFGRYTMDGSTMDMSSEHSGAKSTESHMNATGTSYPDHQYLGNRANGQSLSFARHTMDGSASCMADGFYIQDAELHPWPQSGYSAQ